jgi:tetratricopeptide (TPR) repeat protein
MTSNARPTTNAELESLLKQAFKLAKSGDHEKALELCNWLAEDLETKVDAVRMRATIQELAGQFDEAIDDYEEVMAAANEPADMHALGLLYLQKDLSNDAARVLKKGIQVCIDEQFDYYLNPCRILYAETLLRLHKAVDALEQLEQLPAGYSTYVYGRGNRTKEALVAEAESALP